MNLVGDREEMEKSGCSEDGDTCNVGKLNSSIIEVSVQIQSWSGTMELDTSAAILLFQSELIINILAIYLWISLKLSLLCTLERL